MVKYSVRTNSKFVIIIESIEAQNTLLMKALKWQLEENGLDMSNVSFGFFEAGKESFCENDLRLCPFNNGIAFGDNVNMQVWQNKGKTIHCLPSLSKVLLSIDIQNNQLKNVK